MYFDLDEHDVINIGNENLYRIVAKEKFEAVAPSVDGAVGHTVTIMPGTKGGYVGSEYCLEEYLGVGIKPWIGFPAYITAGSILSGMSAVYGDSSIISGTVIESGCLINDSCIKDSHIYPMYSAYKKDRVLLSILISKKSLVSFTKMCGENIRVLASNIKECEIDKGVDIVINNSEINDMILYGHNEFKNSIISSDGRHLSIKEYIVFYDGVCSNGTPKNIMVKIDGKIYTHKEAYFMLSEKDMPKRGIYHNVEYHPV